jgi:4-aminobutyrate aminotransferase-like enzyme
MKEEKLVDNVREIGAYLGDLLHEYLDVHPHVGNVRGKGLFWGVSNSLARSVSLLILFVD